VTLGPGIDRRRAERDARLLEQGIRELLDDHETRIINEMIAETRARTLSHDRAIQLAAGLTVLHDLLSTCERARRNLRPQEALDGHTPARA
jgi:hypothetical protein